MYALATVPRDGHYGQQYKAGVRTAAQLAWPKNRPLPTAEALAAWLLGHTRRIADAFNLRPSRPDRSGLGSNAHPTGRTVGTLGWVMSRRPESSYLLRYSRGGLFPTGILAQFMSGARKVIRALIKFAMELSGPRIHAADRGLSRADSSLSKNASAQDGSEGDVKDQ